MPQLPARHDRFPCNRLGPATARELQSWPTNLMFHDRTAKAIVADVAQQLQSRFEAEGVTDPLDHGTVQQEVLKALDELHHRIATDSKWLNDLLAGVTQAAQPTEQPTPSRRFDRKRVAVPVAVRIDGLDDPALGLRDVSPGGFAIVSRQSFAVIIAQLHFTVPTGEIFSVEAEAVHCQLERVDPEIQFLSGWRFTGRNTPAVIQALIAAVTMPTDTSET